MVRQDLVLLVFKYWILDEDDWSQGGVNRAEVWMVTLDLAAHYSFFKFSRASTINSTSFLSAPFLEEIISISNLHLSLFSCEASPTFRNLTDILTDRQ